MDHNRILNLPLPDGANQPATKVFTGLNYLHLDGNSQVSGDLDMNNKKKINLLPPTSDTDAATKKYVDDNKVDVSNYLKLDGTNKLTGNLDMNKHRIKSLSDNPTSGTDAVNQNYVNSTISHYHIQPSHQKNEFDYLMSNTLEWTDLVSGGNSFNMTKIADLSKSKGNFHSYNEKVIYTTIIKNSQGGYRYKMVIQCHRLQINVDYTLCIEIVNTDYQLWHKARISIDKTTSQGLTIGSVSVGKFFS